MGANIKATTVKWSLRSDTFHARAGRGKSAAQATCTRTPGAAVRRAAAKFFHVGEERIHLYPEPSGASGQCSAAIGPEPKGDIILSPAEFSALEYIAKRGPGEWVDVVSPQLARHLTAIEEACPDLLGIITNPKPDHSGTKPYLRATVTTVGREWIARTKGGA